MSAEAPVYLDIYIGDKEAHGLEQTSYDLTLALLSKNAAIYGLPSTLAELNEEQQDILKELDVILFALAVQPIHR